MSNYKIEIERWLSSPVVDEATKEQLRSYDDQQAAVAMNGYMKFGTAGLRSKMGAGTALMNTYTVAHATQGLAELIKKTGAEAMSRGVAIAYDSRNNSDVFSKRCAEVLSANGIKCYIYPELRPTPCLSFALRELGCIAGINVTASHNPTEYNGYKVYWEDGAQIGPEQADVICDAIAAIDIFEGVPTSDMAKAELIETIGANIDDRYIEEVLKQRVNPSAIPAVADDFSIVYTPLHGAGITMVPRVLKEAGIKTLAIVEEQKEPNGDFPTLRFPNPEFPEAFDLGRAIADEIGSELIVATDPDADRVGVMAKDKTGTFKCISGNQMGALLLDYIITAYKNTNTMPTEPYAVKSIVSTALCEKICIENGVKMYDVLTGFKFIGEVIKNHFSEGHGTFLLGFEESYGYLKGTYARDKDAVVASLLICEMAAYYKERGMTLCDALDEVFEKYGYYLEKTSNFSFDTPDGAD
ncbi:MAG: phospho-sugar mutase, partial [Clostridia bacterium]|nr:phospho-sugar mutase [Clostridia bacterium]